MSADGLTNTLKVGVVFASILVVTEGVGGLKQAPVAELVWQIESAVEGVVKETVGVAVITSVAPIFTVATEKAPGDPGPKR